MSRFFSIYWRRGFTLIELLVVMAVIAILASLIIVAINPAKQFADARNAQRMSDVRVLLNAIAQYAVDSNGTFPSVIPSISDCATAVGNEVCRSAGAACVGYVDLSVLTANQKYIVLMPIDPLIVNASSNGAGYRVGRNANGRITVCAPLAERGLTISVTQ
ncbi:MAG TPA: type II secretion system protein [Candidatus Paceibacterota bacterium]|nr:type II secretion system protein [Candidatus Paceibacterota bacterium]